MTVRAWSPAWRASLWIGAVTLAGCGANPPAPPAAIPNVAAASAFDATKTGEVVGHVTWAGELPEVKPFLAPVSPLSETARGDRKTWSNPNTPLINPKSRAVAQAVVFLRGVDPRQARPWDLEPVHVELRDYQIHLLQGDAEARCGFVRRGAPIDLQSKQDAFHALQGRGADFFALTFPEQGTARTRTLDRNGLVELLSGAGQFWMRGYLFVDDHPYYARTDADGRFTLPQAPPGEYELVCWMPDWREAGHEIDAETRLVTRMDFGPPLETARPIQIASGQTATVDFTLSLDALKPLKLHGP